MVVEIRQDGAAVLYRGPLAGLRVREAATDTQPRLTLADGQSVGLRVTWLLPLSAGNDVSGKTLNASLNLDATADPGA